MTFKITRAFSGPQPGSQVGPGFFQSSRVKSGQVKGGASKLTGRVGSGQKAFKISRIGSGRVGSGRVGSGRFRRIAGRVGSGKWRCWNLTGRSGRVGSGQEVLKFHGSGRVGSGRVILTRSDPRENIRLAGDPAEVLRITREETSASDEFPS